MSWRVGFGHSQDDLEIQGEIDFDFFEEGSKQNPKNSEPCFNVSGTETPSTSKQVSLHNGSDSIPFTEHIPVVENSVYVSGASACRLDYQMPKDTKLQDCAVYPTKVIETVIPNLGEPEGDLTLDEVKSEGSSGGSLSSSISMSDSDSMSSEDSFDGLSDSESITDVTPLTCNSPYFIDSPRPQSRLAEMLKRQKPEQKEMECCNLNEPSTSSYKKKDSVRFSEDVTCDSDPETNGSVDLNVLVAAIKRLEVQQKHLGARPRSSSNFLSPSATKTRKNMSFSNDEVRRIDQENQRLLKRIVNTQHIKPKSKPSILQLKGSHVAPSQIVRHRKQRQIEAENVALLKRIESAKPSRDCSRSYLLKDFNRLAGTSSRTSSIRSSATSSRPTSSVASFPGSRQSVRSYSLGSLPKSAKTSSISLTGTAFNEPVPNINRLQQQRNST